MIHRLLKNRYLSGAGRHPRRPAGLGRATRPSPSAGSEPGSSEAASDMKAGNSVAARDRLARLAERWPGRAEVLFPLGESELACGRIEQAMIAWSQIPRGSPLAGRSGPRQGASSHSRRAEFSERRANPEGRARRDAARATSELRASAAPDPRPAGAARRGAAADRGHAGDEPGLSLRANGSALLHDHIALDLDTMPLEGNLEFLGRQAAGPIRR